MKLAKVSAISICTFCLVLSGISVCLGGPLKEEPKKPTDSSGISQDKPIKEKIVVEWPKSGNWVAGDVITGPPRTEVFYPKGQSAADWSEMGTIEYDVQYKASDLGGRARLLFLGTQKGSPNAKWNILTRGFKDEEKKDYQFIFFRIDCPDFTSGEPAQVQFWLLMRGKTGLFTVQYSYKGKEIPEANGNAISQTLKDTHIEIEK